MCRLSGFKRQFVSWDVDPVAGHEAERLFVGQEIYFYIKLTALGVRGAVETAVDSFAQLEK